MPEDLKDIDARLHALQQFLKQVRLRGLREVETYAVVAGQAEVSNGAIINSFCVTCCARKFR
jgi:hypothetical protein